MPPPARPPAPVVRRPRAQDFHGLMRHRVLEILLVASPYDAFVLEEAGQLSPHKGEFRHLDLHYSPGLVGATSAAEALEALRDQPQINLVVSALHVGELGVGELARRLRAQRPDVPVVALAFEPRALSDFMAGPEAREVQRTFLWQGDARILLAITKYVEDQANVAHDTRAMGVQVVLLVEDGVRDYSAFLPALYDELLHQQQRLLGEGLNLAHKILRMRARPKVLLCGGFEEALAAFEAYQDDLLGVISDMEFPRAGRRDERAGLALLERVRAAFPDVPVVLQSWKPENAVLAHAAGARFLHKGSPLLLEELRRVMVEDFGFGDFVFRSPEGHAVASADDLPGLAEALRRVPGESIAYHAERNHFSKWLKARTEFAVADQVRPKGRRDFPDVEDLRAYLLRALEQYRLERGQYLVADFDRERHDPAHDFMRLGGGSLGGKARGLWFMRTLLAEAGLERAFEGVRVTVPSSLVLATEVFERFLDDHGLRRFAVDCDDDDEVLRRFAAAPLPADVQADLAAFARQATQPLAVRSSSLLEDARHQPFTGVYETCFASNQHPDPQWRAARLEAAIKRVYASTFAQRAKRYLATTPYRLEEEKMAVIVQRLVGRAHAARFYPDFAGVARSHNFYPLPPQRPEDGIAAVALGLGRTVVEGGTCLRFCPRFPHHVLQLSSPAAARRGTQTAFWALELPAEPQREGGEVSCTLETAEADGTLAALASTYSADNQALYDGLSRRGTRVVSFAPLLKHGLFPLAELLERLLELGAWGLGGPVEIEFAVDLGAREFGFLQLRPLAPTRESEALELGDPPLERLLCRSRSVLGHGRLDDLYDALVVPREGFERARSRETAAELARLNAQLLAEQRPYLLVGVGRWGSADPWLGIPVSWDQISGARAIVEAGFADVLVAPSQGTHFFQNLAAFHVGYFTVNPDAGQGFVDWSWLQAQPALYQAAGVRHLRWVRPLLVAMDGRRREGLIYKPR